LNQRRHLYRMQTRVRPPLPERRPRLAYLFAVGPTLAVVALLAMAPFLYRVDKATSTIFDPPSAAAGGAAPTTVPGVEPISLPDWTKKERVNVIVVGVDKRDDDEFARTDTIILVSIDPLGKTIGMMSLPRDLKVTIPGYGPDKINAAYAFGERVQRVGGGVGLLRDTLKSNFQINVPYYAEVDFRGFEKIIDTFGGVNVDPPYPIVDDEYPTETYGYTSVYFPAGLQHLDGKAALQYARTRHADTDFGRSRRQQEIILALRQQALNSNLINQFFPLLDILGSSVHTNLPREEVPALVNLVSAIPKVTQYTLQDLASEEIGPDGTSYVHVDLPQARSRIRDMIPDAGKVLPTPTPDATAKIAVRNGTLRDKFAARSVDRLKAGGFSGAVVDPTAVTDQTLPLANTVIYVYGDKGDAGILAAKTIGLTSDSVRQGTGQAPNGVDILVVLGDDAPDSGGAVPTPTVRR
jgi:LCP family protein required for cell wall assembly